MRRGEASFFALYTDLYIMFNSTHSKNQYNTSIQLILMRCGDNGAASAMEIKNDAAALV